MGPSPPGTSMHTLFPFSRICSSLFTRYPPSGFTSYSVTSCAPPCQPPRQPPVARNGPRATRGLRAPLPVNRQHETPATCSLKHASASADAPSRVCDQPAPNRIPNRMKSTSLRGADALSCPTRPAEPQHPPREASSAGQAYAGAFAASGQQSTTAVVIEGPGLSRASNKDGFRNPAWFKSVACRSWNCTSRTMLT